jgi:hypothetical protein
MRYLSTQPQKKGLELRVVSTPFQREIDRLS